MTSRASPDEILSSAAALRWEIGANLHDAVMEAVYTDAAQIADRAVTRRDERPRFDMDRTIDRMVTGRRWGFPTMTLLLVGVLWLTVVGANYPSALISSVLLDTFHPALKGFATALGMPWWLTGPLIDGSYMALGWVVSVMFPPMAIFFPLFTMLEDFGYLPRVAFNLDHFFKKAGAHGKQALTMCMGLGCNAAGVVAARVIDSPRERLIAIITNNFAICNGRWPTQIMISTIFIGALVPPHLAGLVSAWAVVGVVLLGVILTFVVSWGLSSTVLRGEASTFHLELPPYRPPRILRTLYTSLIDRTIFVLWRAMVFAAPAGAVIWLVANVRIGSVSLSEHLIPLLHPFGLLIGLNGIILLAYLVAIPANEIVIPTVLMLTVMTARLSGVGAETGVIFAPESASATGAILKAGGWTLLTGVNTMLFSLVHNPCSTTLFTIWKETRDMKWVAVSALLPLTLGFALCFLVTQVWHLACAG